uniref:Uncharacterized protein n=1 Tax=Arundo donax TaxID=35708 RepID=A0A0A9BTH1_ARUDO
MTTNIAEVYNWVIRGLHGLPLVAIVEGMLYDVIDYYQKRHSAAVLHAATVGISYCYKIMVYMEEKVKKGQGLPIRAFGINKL